MGGVISTALWVALILYLVGFRFRTEISGLLGRLKKAGREGLEFSSAEAQTSATPVPHEILPTSFLPPTLAPIFEKSRDAVRRDLPSFARRLGLSPEDALVHAVADAAAALHLERSTRFILGSQLRALQLLCDRGGIAPMSDIEAVYVADAARQPELYRHLTYPEWRNYLLTGNLIESSGEDAVLTPEGRAVIPYMSLRGYPFNLPG